MVGGPHDERRCGVGGGGLSCKRGGRIAEGRKKCLERKKTEIAVEKNH